MLLPSYLGTDSNDRTLVAKKKMCSREPMARKAYKWLKYTSTLLLFSFRVRQRGKKRKMTKSKKIFNLYVNSTFLVISSSSFPICHSLFLILGTLVVESKKEKRNFCVSSWRRRWLNVINWNKNKHSSSSCNTQVLKWGGSARWKVSGKDVSYKFDCKSSQKKKSLQTR